jgi:hypothetical protein
MNMNSVSERLVYNNAKRSLRNANIALKDGRPAQSFLRLEQALSISKANYEFPITNQNNGVTPFLTEKRLNLQDSFALSALQVTVAKPSGTTDVTFKKYTYLNPFVFTNADAMGVIYNGSLSLMVDNTTYLPDWDIERHLYVPETQQTAPAGSGSPLDQYNGSETGYFPAEPNVTLIGSKNMRLQILLPSAPTAIDANSRLIITMRGILVQSSTSVR